MTRVAYLGTSDFAATVLRGLCERGHRPVLVVSRPDAPRGRGRKLGPPPVAVAARELGIDLEQPADVNAEDARAAIAAADVDVLVVCAFGALIGSRLLADYATLNVHPSLLPRWRGAAPIERALMAGDTEIGVSIIRLVAELDAGPVCAQQSIPLSDGDSYGSVVPRIEQLSIQMLADVLESSPECVEQPSDGVTYAEKITAADRTLDPARPAVENVRVVRALHPHIGARIQLPDGSFLGIQEARVGAGGELELVTVQPAGGRPMPYADYLRGHAAVL